jgi:hypothetical protein
LLITFSDTHRSVNIPFAVGRPTKALEIFQRQIASESWSVDTSSSFQKMHPAQRHAREISSQIGVEGGLRREHQREGLHSKKNSNPSTTILGLVALPMWQREFICATFFDLSTYGLAPGKRMLEMTAKGRRCLRGTNLTLRFQNYYCDGLTNPTSILSFYYYHTVVLTKCLEFYL